MLVYISIFIFGTIIGSFLNVIILRRNTGESFFRGGSRCFTCGEKLKWRELIPVLSFIIQKGKCRSCKSKISFQYPLTEITTGLLFLLIFQITHYSLLITGYYFIIFSLLIIIAVYDLRHQIIPDKFVYSFIILSFLNFGFVSNFEFRISDFMPSMLIGLSFFLFFGLLYLVSNGKAMGLGDAKLGLGIGFLLGFPNALVAMLISFWSGALAAILLLILSKKRYNLKSRIAFGPFLALGTIIAFLL